MSDPTMRAFLEDLAVVFFKHKKIISSYEIFVDDMGKEIKAMVIGRDDDLMFDIKNDILNEKPSENERNKAVVYFPQTAHEKLEWVKKGEGGA